MSRHVNPQALNRKSKAPYNFVPLPEAVFLAPTAEQDTPPWKRFDEYIPDAHTGWIDLTIKTETPLYVRGAQKEDSASNPDFFHHGKSDQPVIPGSSIRGMIRNLVEILSFGKVGHTKSRRLYFRSLGNDAMARLYREQFDTNAQHGRRCGLFRRTKGDGEIVPCEFARVLESKLTKLVPSPVRTGNSANSLPNWCLQHQRVFAEVCPGERDPQVSKIRLASNDKPQGQEKEGILIITGWSHNKKKEFVFFPTEEPAFEVDSDVIKDFEDDDQLSAWQQDAFPKDEPQIGARRLAGLLRDEEPVFFLQGKDQKVLALGRAGMFRLPYNYRTEDMIPKMLRQPRAVDLAMAIFGTVGFDGQMIKGRVYFEDLCWDKKRDPFIEKGKKGLRSPKVLSSPKPIAFQHYLTQNDPDNERKLLHYNSSPEKTRIRGHKRYWHKHKAEPFEDKISNDKQHTIIRPVQENTVFKGRVRFENLSCLELGALLSALQLPPSKRHHLGMGKPLGMGSVKIEAELHATVRTGEASRYASLFASDGEFNLGELSADQNEEIEKTAKEEFRKELVRHYNNNVDNKVDKNTDLWNIPRLQVLALMLEWDEAPSREKTEYEPLGDTWRQRRVLPTPHGVVDASEPHWDDVSLTEKTLFKQGDRIQVEVTAIQGSQYTLKVLEPGHDETVVFDRLYWNKQVGESLRVKVQSIGADGTIKKITP